MKSRVRGRDGNRPRFKVPTKPPPGRKFVPFSQLAAQVPQLTIYNGRVIPMAVPPAGARQPGRSPFPPSFEPRQPPMTRAQLSAKRTYERLPHPSYDLDNDGVVDSKDYFIAKQFDVDRDGQLNETEKESALKALNEGYSKIDHRNISDKLKTSGWNRDGVAERRFERILSRIGTDDHSSKYWNGQTKMRIIESSMLNGPVPMHRNTFEDPTPIVGALNLAPNAPPDPALRKVLQAARAQDRAAAAARAEEFERNRIQKVHDAYDAGVDQNLKIPRMTELDRERIEKIFEMRELPLAEKITKNAWESSREPMTAKLFKQQGLSAGAYPRKDDFSAGKYIQPKQKFEETFLAVFGEADSTANRREMWTSTSKASYIAPTDRVQGDIERALSMKGYIGSPDYSVIDPVVSHSHYPQQPYNVMLKPAQTEQFKMIPYQAYRPPGTAPVGATRPAFVPPSDLNNSSNSNDSNNNTQQQTRNNNEDVAPNSRPSTSHVPLRINAGVQTLYRPSTSHLTANHMHKEANPTLHTGSTSNGAYGVTGTAEAAAARPMTAST